MKYTNLGKTGLSVSTLGFGCMRLPAEGGKILRELATPLLRRAVELGINYFDTAIEYCNGESQAALGEALAGLRERVIISTKNHQHSAAAGQWRRYLEDSLELLRTDYIDIYSHHGISWEIFRKYLDPGKGGLTREMLRAKEEGLIGHIGFSFHDEPENLVRLIDTGYYEVVTLQYNLLDRRNAEAMQHARESGMGVVVMGPVGGGRLGLPSEKISQLVGGGVNSTPEAALRFVWGTPGVDVALSGMENMRMLEENARIADTGPFAVGTIEKLNEMVAERKRRSGLYCTACRYCISECPRGIAIPENLELLNLSLIYDLHDSARNRYLHLKGKAVECEGCGRCVAKCPQKIDIPAQLRKTAMLLDEHAGTLRYDAAIDEIDPEGRFTLELKMFNFSEETKNVHMRVKPADGAVVTPDAFEISDIPPFARITRKVEGSFPPSPQGGAINMSADCTSDGERLTIDKVWSFVFLHSGVADDWESGEWYQFGPSEDDFVESRETTGRHRVRFKLSRDEEMFVMLADVHDDFLFPTVRKRHKDETGDCLELCLNDCRLFLYPGTPGTAPPFYEAPRTDMKIKLRADKTDSGYRLRAQIPFTSFGGHAPKMIKFNLACHTANSNGVRIGRYAWAGEASRELWLV